MSRADGVLVVSLTHKWFDMIESGEKLEEYRGENWWQRLLGDEVLLDLEETELPLSCFLSSPDIFHDYHTLRAQRAYSGVWLERKIKCIRWGKPRPEWSGETVTGECFVIELEKGF